MSLKGFLARTKRDPESGCLIWTGYVMKNGYGSWSRDDRSSVLAHRYSYEVYVGPIPDGFHVDHLCRNTRCVEPSHLEAVTPAENNRRSSSLSAQNLRKTHCKNGHEFTPENTYRVKGRSRRLCRACTRASQYAAYWARKAAGAEHMEVIDDREEQQ